MILLKVWPYIAAIAGVIGVYLFGRRDGAHKVEKDNLTKAVDHDRKAAAIASEVKDEISKMDDDDVVSELERDWMRNPKKRTFPWSK